jgi:cytochrome c-type biogenesis protein CcmF
MVSRALNLGFSAYAMVLAHLGLGIFVTGAVVESHARQTQMLPLSIGQTLKLGDVNIRFLSISKIEGANYDAQVGRFLVSNAQNTKICETTAQRRFYPHSSEVMGKVGLCFIGLSDYYIVLSDPVINDQNKQVWQVRAFHNPWIRLVFIGPLMMALAGFLAMFGFASKTLNSRRSPKEGIEGVS